MMFVALAWGGIPFPEERQEQAHIAEMTELGITHNLACKYTSFVAVHDNVVAAPSSGSGHGHAGGGEEGRRAGFDPILHWCANPSQTSPAHSLSDANGGALSDEDEDEEDEEEGCYRR